MTRPNSGPRSAVGGLHRAGGLDSELFDQSLASTGVDRGTEPETSAPQYETGTTIVALTAADAVVMAADRRMSLGGRFTANKHVQKVERVHPTAAMSISGTVGPAQDLLDQIRAETSLYESRRGDPMSVHALAKTAGHLVRGLPVAPLLGGVDDSGPHVYELDGGGSVLEDEYAAGGSGMQVAYGVLEGRFEPDLTTAEATDVATAAVDAASERDTASGNGVTVATVTDEGVTVEGGDGDDGADDVAGPGTDGDEEVA